MKKNYKKPLMVAVTIDDNILAFSMPFTLESIPVDGDKALGKRRGGSLDLEDEEEEEDE